MNNSYITIIKEKRTDLSRKRIPLNQNKCTADFRMSVPFEQNLQQNGTITYKGVTFVCDTDRNRITLGDVTDRSKCLNISLKGGGCLMVNRDNLSDLSQAITMFCPEDINRIMTAIAEDKRAQQMLLEKDEMESSVGEIITE